MINLEKAVKKLDLNLLIKKEELQSHHQLSNHTDATEKESFNIK